MLRRISRTVLSAIVIPGKAWYAVRRWPIIPAIVLLTMAGTAITAPLIAPHDPIQQDLSFRNAPPIWYSGGTSEHIFGADHVGRDILSRLIWGARISLMVIAVAVMSGLLVGVTLGLVAGYLGGLVDELIMRSVDVWFALPFILIALVAVVVFGASLQLVIALLALSSWARLVRFVRGEALSLKERDYVALAKISGASGIRIMIRHILPGVMNTVIVVATLQVGQLVLAEATLSFIGAGIPSPTPAWGVMVSDARNYVSTAWWTAFFPGAAIFLVVMSINFLGDWMRDHFDPRLRQLH
ncbi:MAG: ABC transporter permease [Dehalococcoidia bacterium]|nr:ABC transporter permease [Dehalococcoidia bacterium]